MYLIYDENGELMIVLPDEMTNELNWQPGDRIEWIDNKNGTFTLKKKNLENFMEE